MNTAQAAPKFKFPFSAADRPGCNQCLTCNKLFTSISGFDKHRIGTYGLDRRCAEDSYLVSQNMEQKVRSWSKGLLVWSFLGDPERVL